MPQAQLASSQGRLSALQAQYEAALVQSEAAKQLLGRAEQAEGTLEEAWVERASLREKVRQAESTGSHGHVEENGPLAPGRTALSLAFASRRLPGRRLRS